MDVPLVTGSTALYDGIGMENPVRVSELFDEEESEKSPAPVQTQSPMPQTSSPLKRLAPLRLHLLVKHNPLQSRVLKHKTLHYWPHKILFIYVYTSIIVYY